MSNRKGFNLVEMIVVLIIIAILASIALTSYTTQLMQAAAKAAQNNLITLYNAQKNYFFTNNRYCTTSSATDATACAGPANCAQDINAINCNLSLNLTDNNFIYFCTNASTFTCTATSISDNNLSLIVTDNSIILPGGATCASSTGANPGCNPSCSSTNNPIYCPSN